MTLRTYRDLHTVFLGTQNDKNAPDFVQVRSSKLARLEDIIVDRRYLLAGRPHVNGIEGKLDRDPLAKTLKQQGRGA